VDSQYGEYVGTMFEFYENILNENIIDNLIKYFQYYILQLKYVY